MNSSAKIQHIRRMPWIGLQNNMFFKKEYSMLLLKPYQILTKTVWKKFEQKPV